MISDYLCYTIIAGDFLQFEEKWNIKQQQQHKIYSLLNPNKMLYVQFFSVVFLGSHKIDIAHIIHT